MPWPCSTPSPAWNDPESKWRRQANRYGVPRICFINKMDRIGANFFRSVDMIRDRLKAKPVCLQIPIGSEDKFDGVVDLINGRSVRFEKESKGLRIPMVKSLRISRISTRKSALSCWTPWRKKMKN